MAAPTKYTQKLSREPPQEDCRDYLRTGRCKYGAACKYNHPPNVQTGGGLKPLDPSEPQFPLRPGEPSCQYYVKNGTCKFGQACKFHHPLQSELAAMPLGGSTVILGRNGKGGQQIVLDSAGGSAVGLQFLPQRPDEPDCIYFLRNGRCKYGATCRYHHPVAINQGTTTEVRGTPVRRQAQAQRSNESIGEPRLNSTGQALGGVSYAARAQQGAQSTYTQQVQRESRSWGGSPTHFVVTETPLVAVVSGSAPVPSSSYHRTVRSDSLAEEYPVSTGVTNFSMHQDYNSSSSSIASSYATAPSSFEMLPPSVQQGHCEPSGTIWSRPVRRTGSGGSLSAYDSTPPLGPQSAAGGSRSTLAPSGSRSSLVPSGSDHSIASRGQRAGSIGSASDYSAAYHDASTGRAWVEPSSSFEQGRRPPNPHYNRGERKLPQDSRRGPAAMHGRDARFASEAPQDDGGLSMMTSALLNMLDTPEDAAMKSYASHESSSRTQVASPPSTPRSGHTSYSQAMECSPLEDRILSSTSTMRRDNYSYSRSAHHEPPPGYYSSHTEFTHNAVPEHDQVNGTNSFTPVRGPPGDDAPRHHPRSEQAGVSPTWSPSWQGVSSASCERDPNAQHMAVLQQQPPSAPGSPHNPSDVGLYLP